MHTHTRTSYTPHAATNSSEKRHTRSLSQRTRRLRHRSCRWVSIVFFPLRLLLAYSNENGAERSQHIERQNTIDSKEQKRWSILDDWSQLQTTTTVKDAYCILWCHNYTHNAGDAFLKEKKKEKCQFPFRVDLVTFGRYVMWCVSNVYRRHRKKKTPTE